MYSVSKDMPIESFQIIQPSDNQVDFIAGQVIRFNIPRATGFWDSKLSRAQFLVKTTGANYKMCFNSPYAGVASIWDMIRITQNGVVISEITDYNQLQHTLKGYELSLSGMQRVALTEGLVDYNLTDSTGYKALSNSCICGQGVHRTGAVSATDMQQEVKFQLSLDFISLFELLEVVPSSVFGDIMIEFRLAQTNQQILKVLPATGATHTCSTGFTTAGTTVAITPPFTGGYTCLADSPFIVGMRINAISDGVVHSTEHTISALSEDKTTGIITITISAAAGALDNGTTTFIISAGADGVEAPQLTNFFVSKAELQLQVIKPSAQYIADTVQEAESGQMFIDVNTFTSYRNTIPAGIKKTTLIIPTTQNRVSAFFTVPRFGNQTGTFSKSNDKEWNYDGVFGNLQSYQSQISGLYYPNSPVDLSVMCGGWHFSQEHIREIEKAADSAKVALRSLLGVKQNFMIARTLGAYNSTTNLTGENINLYLDYLNNGPTSTSYPTASATIGTAGTNFSAMAAPYYETPSATSGAGSGMKVRCTQAAAATPWASQVWEIVEQGSGYASGDTVTVIPTGATTLTLGAGGDTYTNGTVYPTVSTTAGVQNSKKGVGLTITVTTAGAPGAVTGVAIANPGYGYLDGDTVLIVGGNNLCGVTVNVNPGTSAVLDLAKPSISCDALTFVAHKNRIAVSTSGIAVIG